jgi:hypothetical protein
VTRVSFKTSRVPVANDENADTNEMSSKLIGGKSKIPIDVSKTQMAVTKKIKSKPLSRISAITELKPIKEVAFSTNLIPFNVENIDVNDINNVFLTPDYVNEIYSYLRHLEVRPLDH